MLLGQLAEADTPKETEAIRLRLDIARADAARAKAEFQRSPAARTTPT